MQSYIIKYCLDRNYLLPNLGNPLAYYSASVFFIILRGKLSSQITLKQNKKTGFFRTLRLNKSNSLQKLQEKNHTLVLNVILDK